MRVYAWVLCGVAGGLLSISFQALPALAAEAYPVFTDVNQGALEVFGARGRRRLERTL